MWCNPVLLTPTQSSDFFFPQITNMAQEKPLG